MEVERKDIARGYYPLSMRGIRDFLVPFADFGWLWIPGSKKV